MIKIADIVGSLGHCFEAQRALEQCRASASGDKDYYSYSYVQDVKQAEAGLEQTLNAYIDQRVAQKLAGHNPPSAFEPQIPIAFSPALPA
jgi:hypothetical protein